MFRGVRVTLLIAFGLTVGQHPAHADEIADGSFRRQRSLDHPRELLRQQDDRRLVLRVMPMGGKTWNFVYRSAGTPQWLTLGSYPAVSLADARALALDKRHAVEVEGRDPAAERRTEREIAKLPPAAAPAVYTFADLATLYETFAKGKKKTWKDDVAKIRRHLLPAWGVLPLRSITRVHVHELLDRLAGQGMTIGVNRVQALISRLFTLALDRSVF